MLPNRCHLFSASFLTCLSEKRSSNNLDIQALVTLNLQVALFRDLLLDVGGSKDCPALREKVRRVRLAAVDAVLRTHKTILPNIA